MIKATYFVKSRLQSLQLKHANLPHPHLNYEPKKFFYNIWHRFDTSPSSYRGKEKDKQSRRRDDSSPDLASSRDRGHKLYRNRDDSPEQRNREKLGRRKKEDGSPYQHSAHGELTSGVKVIYFFAFFHRWRGQLSACICNFESFTG